MPCLRRALHERFVVSDNPEQATRDAALREVMLGELTDLIAGASSLLTFDRSARLPVDNNRLAITRAAPRTARAVGHPAAGSGCLRRVDNPCSR
jgi:hypothetical protein